VKIKQMCRLIKIVTIPSIKRIRQREKGPRSFSGIIENVRNKEWSTKTFFIDLRSEVTNHRLLDVGGEGGLGSGSGVRDAGGINID